MPAKKKSTSKKKKKNLVIVESPAKAKTIEKYLGKDSFKVVASMGHIRDLPKSRIGVDVEHDFEPDYIIMRDKRKVLKTLKEIVKKSDLIYLAPDPDREGEAIAWHLKYALDLPEERIRRIEFNEITKSAVVAAIDQPRNIDLKRVDAQQARRILDRLVGYGLSPILWKKIRRGLSAGRVQSVAVKIICDREAEIEAFIPDEYWTISIELSKDGQSFAVKLITDQSSEEIKFANKQEADSVLNILQQKQLNVTDVKIKKKERKSYAPYITSTLQQDASNKLNFSTRKTMMIAQQLYEGLSIEDEQVGLITYMRTDSVRISDYALDQVRQFINEKYGQDYLPEKANLFKSKKSAQDAHEAIRPSAIERTPESLAKFLNKDQLKLYKLIWQRFVASQMTNAIFEQHTIDIGFENYILRANKSKLVFPGFYMVYPRKEDESNLLPDMAVNDRVELSKADPEQHFTQPPPRYNEASLVKLLEELGIGRPSTYAPIVSTIISRDYVRREDKKLIPTDLGKLVNSQLEQFFKDIIDVNFTAELEAKLDKIMDGDVDWKNVLKEFYQPFSTDLKNAEQKMEDMKIPDRPSDEVCDVCKKPMVIKHGRYGDFLACSGFPECKNTKSIPKFVGDLLCPECGGRLVERRSKKGRTFYGCNNYPDCLFVSWDKPIPDEKCEKCDNFLIEKNINKEKQKLCISCDSDIINPKG